jgi:surface protein
MNKKIVAFALSTTALLGAGAMAETTPFNGVAANAAYAYETEAEILESSELGELRYTLYSDNTLVVGEGRFTPDELREVISMAGYRVNADVALVFEQGATLEGSGEGLLMYRSGVKSVSGTLTVNGSMKQAFSGVMGLKTFDLKLSGESHVTDMAEMLSDCGQLTSADLSGWDVSNVTSMRRLFAGDRSLVSVVVQGWNTSNVTTMESMFLYCTSLTSVDMSGLDTSQVSSMALMFEGCESLESADLSGWVFLGFPNLDSMFMDCSNLTTLNLTGWNTACASYTSTMFDGSNAISSITLGKTDDVSFLDHVPSSEAWVLASDPSFGTFTLGEIANNWNRDTMTGTWVLASSLPAPAPEVTPVAVYRLYNPNSGEHFYTLSEVERDATVAAGWNDEGIGWYAPDESDAPVYRLYSGTDHHYTMDEEEKDALIEEGWVDEGVAFYSADPEDGIALLRQFNPNVDPEAETNNSGSHNYTTDQVENDYLVSLGWQAEDVAFYGMAVDAE